MATKKGKLYRVECLCDLCGTFLMGSDKKPHLTVEELGNRWTMLVMSAPLNAPRCPNPECRYSTFNDCNMGLTYLIDDGKKKVPSKEFWEINR